MLNELQVRSLLACASLFVVTSGCVSFEEANAKRAAVTLVVAESEDWLFECLEIALANQASDLRLDRKGTRSSTKTLTTHWGRSFTDSEGKYWSSRIVVSYRAATGQDISPSEFVVTLAVHRKYEWIGYRVRANDDEDAALLALSRIRAFCEENEMELTWDSTKD